MRTDVIRLRLAVLLLVLLLAACGPGTGGTGLPPASSGGTGTGLDAGTPVDGGVPPPAASPPGTAPPASAPNASMAVVVPDRAPDRVGTVESIDAVFLQVAGLPVARAQVDVLLADGSAASAAVLRVGDRVSVWVVGDRVVLRLQS